MDKGEFESHTYEWAFPSEYHFTDVNDDRTETLLLYLLMVGDSFHMVRRWYGNTLICSLNPACEMNINPWAFKNWNTFAWGSYWSRCFSTSCLTLRELSDAESFSVDSVQSELVWVWPFFCLYPLPNTCSTFGCPLRVSRLDVFIMSTNLPLINLILPAFAPTGLSGSIDIDNTAVFIPAVLLGIGWALW